MPEKVDVTVSMPKELRDKIDSQLDYRDTRSEWIRDAVKQKLNSIND